MQRSTKIKDRKSYEQFKLHLSQVEQATKNGAPISESKDIKSTRIERLKKNYAQFFEYYFPHYCTDESGKFSGCADFHINFAELIRKEPIVEVAQRWGRGLAKSVHSDMGIPIWLWARGETIYEVLVGNNETSAKTLLDDVRAEFESNFKLIQDFGSQQLLGKWEEGDFQTRDGKFIAKGLGMGQNVRGLRVAGQRPNYIVCDDLEDQKTVKNPSRQNEIAEWILRALMPTMTSSHRRTLIIANNHFHPITIQELFAQKNKYCKVIRVDACNKNTYDPVWPQRDSKEKYQQLASRGMLAFLSEYCNEPHVQGSIFTSEQIIYLNSKEYPRPSEMEFTIGYWDIAYGGTSTSDYNAIAIFGFKGQKYYHIASFAKQCKMEEALSWLAAFINVRRTEKPIHLYYESQFWNDAVQQSIKEAETKHGVQFNFTKSEKPKGNKYDRILTLQPFFQRGEILFSTMSKSDPHLQVGISQLMGIEPGYKSHDDWPDALEGCIKLLQYNTKANTWVDPITPHKPRNKYRI